MSSSRKVEGAGVRKALSMGGAAVATHGGESDLSSPEHGIAELADA